jgi:hypothetical protein
MQGQLFSQDFLTRGILETQPCEALTDAALEAVRLDFPLRCDTFCVSL